MDLAYNNQQRLICYKTQPTNYLIANAIFVERKCWYSLTHWLGNKEVYTFPKGISPEVNLIS